LVGVVHLGPGVLAIEKFVEGFDAGHRPRMHHVDGYV
jgi:hypothetical protein